MSGPRLVTLASLLALVTACAGTPAPPGGSPGVPVSFVLIQPETGKPAARTPYRLTFGERHILSAPPGVNLITDSVAEGTTDALGRTDTLQLDAPDNGDHVLLLRHGVGNFGTFFELSDSDQPSRPIAGQRYLITGCKPGEQYEGVTDPAGRTVYYSGDEQCDISLSVAPQERIAID